MKELLEQLRKIKDTVVAIDKGVKRFAEVLPVLTKQHIATTAKRKLNSSADNYIDAISSEMKNYVLVVEIDRDNWLANAVESGADPFSIKEGLLRSSKAKVSKEGYRYMSVPMGKDPKREKMGTDKGQAIQNQIREIMLKPKFGNLMYRQNDDGSIWEYQNIVSEDLGGFYRTRLYQNQTEVSKKNPKWGYVMFRTASENPKSESKWDHPGIQASNILRDTETWLHQAVPTLLENFIEQEISRIK